MRQLSAILAATLTVMLAGGAVYADIEWEQTTPYYEDDAWYDISEWFDGNDYNPTDEEALEWDDEVYQFDVDEIDTDNNWNYGYYDDTIDDDWFYDYYDEGAYTYYDWDDDTELYEWGSRYYDYDNDGFYDAYATWLDTDMDGEFEDYDYYSLNGMDSAGEKQSEEEKAKEQQAQKESPSESKQGKFSGTIEKIKRVDVRNRQNMVLAVAGEEMDMFVDVGPAEKLQDIELQKGDEITVSGMMSKVGDKKLIIAQSMESGGQTKKIDRSRREHEGKVVSHRTTKIRGSEHLIAMVNLGPKAGKVAVDLGPADKLDLEIEQGTSLEFTGVPVKVKDRKMMLAQKVKKSDGEWMSIDRRSGKQSAGS